MKHLMIAAVASLGLVSAAAAQTTITTTTGTGTTSGTSSGTAVTTGGSGTTVTTGGATTGTVTIQPEVRTRVREYVTTSRPRAVTAPSGFTVRRGVALPETIEVQTFPSTVGVTNYRYAVIGDQTVLVDSSSRQIVEILD